MKVILSGGEIANAVAEYLARRGLQPKKDGQQWCMKMHHDIVGNSTTYTLTIDTETPPLVSEPGGGPYR